MVPAVSSGTMSLCVTIKRAFFGPSAGLVHEITIPPVRAGLPLRATVAVTVADPLPDDVFKVIQESAVAVHPHVPVVRARSNENVPPSPMMLCDVVLSE